MRPFSGQTLKSIWIVISATCENEDIFFTIAFFLNKLFMYFGANLIHLNYQCIYIITTLDFPSFRFRLVLDFIKVI